LVPQSLPTTARSPDVTLEEQRAKALTFCSPGDQIGAKVDILIVEDEGADPGNMIYRLNPRIEEISRNRRSHNSEDSAQHWSERHTYSTA